MVVLIVLPDKSVQREIQLLFMQMIKLSYFKHKLMVDNKEQNQSWWATLPGIITGMATLITAIGGLIVILNSNGFINNGKHVIDDTTSSFHQTTIIPTNSPSLITGRFPQASERLLTFDDVRNLSKTDLKIMRNEIFARRGYIFKTSDMKTYFEYQSWYSPKYDDVTPLFTEIEKKNISLIKNYE